MQLLGRAVSVPGRALGGVVELLQSAGLTPEAHQLLVAYHAAVVESLTSQGVITEALFT